MKSVLDELERRGLVEGVTSPELRKQLDTPTSLYIGFDPTADSLHIGNLLGMVVAGWFQRYGHRVIALVGGATGFIGDPSGKSHERPSLTPEQLERNLQGIRRDLESVLGTERVEILNNYDWFAQIGFIEFLRDIGKAFRMGPMLSKEMVRSRLDSAEGLSFTEFSYQALQAYDFLHLYKDQQVTLQLGGSDQWGNITAGTELIRKQCGGQAYGLTFPLLVRSDGKKFGKSEGSAIWLSPERLSPYEFYQYFIRVPDTDIIRLMRMLTYMPMEEVQEWEERMKGDSYVPNLAQKRLAEEVTTLVHGRDAVQAAQAVTAAVKPGALAAALTADVLETLTADMPSVELTHDTVAGAALIDLLVITKLAKSKGEARRLIQGGGVSLNNARITAVDHQVSKEALIEGRLALIGVGKKRKVLVRVTHA